MKINNVYGVRVLPGVHLAPETVGYGILGYARGDMKLSTSEEGETPSKNYKLNGYQVGLGSMTDLSKNVALRGDLIYTGYKSKTIVDSADSTGSANVKLKPSTMEFNIVAVYKFG